MRYWAFNTFSWHFAAITLYSDLAVWIVYAQRRLSQSIMGSNNMTTDRLRAHCGRVAARKPMIMQIELCFLLQWYGASCISRIGMALGIMLSKFGGFPTTCKHVNKNKSLYAYVISARITFIPNALKRLINAYSIINDGHKFKQTFYHESELLCFHILLFMTWWDGVAIYSGRINTSKDVISVRWLNKRLRYLHC